MSKMGQQGGVILAQIKICILWTKSTFPRIVPARILFHRNVLPVDKNGKQVFPDTSFPDTLNRLVMPDFDLTINIVVLFVLIGLAALTGFGFRSRQLAKKNRQIAELEKEVMQVSAEILQVQKEYCELELKIKDLNIPVIPMRKGTAAVVAKDNGEDQEKRISG